MSDSSGTSRFPLEHADLREDSLRRLNLTQGLKPWSFGFSCSRASRWALRKIAKAGGAPETLVKSYSLKPVVVDEAHLYFFAEEGIFNDLLSTF